MKINRIISIVLLSLFASLFQQIPLAVAATAPGAIPNTAGQYTITCSPRPYVQVAFTTNPNNGGAAITNYEYAVKETASSSPWGYPNPSTSELAELTFRPLDPSDTGSPFYIPTLANSFSPNWNHVFLRAVNSVGAGTAS